MLSLLEARAAAEIRETAPRSNGVKAGTSFFAGSVQLGIAVIVAEVLYLSYDMSRAPIRDLGATCNSSLKVFQPSSNIFNGSLVIFGQLILFGGFEGFVHVCEVESRS